jgi:hypothetical protein
MAQDPIGIAQGCDWVGTKVRGLKARRSCSRYAQKGLEVFIESVEQAICEALAGSSATPWLLQHITFRLTQRKKIQVTRQRGNKASRMDSSEALVTWSSRVRNECLRNIVVFFFCGEPISATGDAAAEECSRRYNYSPRELMLRVVL